MTLSKANAVIAQRKCSLWEAIRSTATDSPGLKKFVHLGEQLIEQASAGAPSLALLDLVLEQTGYLEHLKAAEEDKFKEREENIEELRRACFDKDVEVCVSPRPARSPLMLVFLA